MTGTARLRPAAGADLPWARSLLHAAGLPADGLEDQFPVAYLVREEAGRPVALAGLERYGRAGLLRSVAVDASRRGTGAGAAVVAELVARGRRDGLAAIYLLTTSAAAWFPRFGFQPIDRADLPAELADSPEVAGGCPASAAVMRLVL